MSNLVATVLGMLFLVCWVCIMIYGNSLSKAYGLGRDDYNRRKNRTVEYKWLARVAYKRGRHGAACARHKELKRRLRSSKLTI